MSLTKSTGEKKEYLDEQIFIDIYFLLYLALTQCFSIQKTQLTTVQTFPGGVDLAGSNLDWAGSLLKHKNVDMLIQNSCLVQIEKQRIRIFKVEFL